MAPPIESDQGLAGEEAGRCAPECLFYPTRPVFWNEVATSLPTRPYYYTLLTRCHASTFACFTNESTGYYDGLVLRANRQRGLLLARQLLLHCVSLPQIF